MFDERSYISRLESAEPEELLKMLRRPTADEEAALRTYLGDNRYRRMHDLALRQTRAAAGEPKGNVVVIHGIMGGELTVYRHGKAKKIWVKALRLAAGAMQHLRLDEHGREEHNRDCQVRATGLMKKHYGELILSLSARWSVRTFWFDWRKDLNVAAADLAAKIAGWYSEGTPFHIVAHSMGGLVSRTLILNHPQIWKRMASRGLEQGGRLIMLGTPNHGSFAVPQIITGLEGMVRKLAKIDLRHNRQELLEIVNSFRGSYQMMPSHLVLPHLEPLYQSGTWADSAAVPQPLLDNAREHHEKLAKVVDAERMIYVAGYDQPTLNDVDPRRVAEGEAYSATLMGDGRVPHKLGLLEDVPTYYVDEGHGALPGNKLILRALDSLLETGATRSLADRVPATRALSPADDSKEAVRRLRELESRDDRELEAYLRRTRFSRSLSTAEPDYVSGDERLVEDTLTRGFLSVSAEEETQYREDTALPKPKLQVRVLYCPIQEVHEQSEKRLPVDAIAVGHYQGTRPTGAVYWVNKVMSKALVDARGNGEVPAEENFLLTQLSERRIIRAELGQPFLMPDPRAKPTDRTARVIVVAGMGIPGRFGEPELMVLARELVWTLGRLNKRHLATVLIGAGQGNLSEVEAVSGWLRGAYHALISAASEGDQIKRLTFCEWNPKSVLSIDKAIQERADVDSNRLTVDYTPLDRRQSALLLKSVWADQERQTRREVRRTMRALKGEAAERDDPEPTRLTLSVEQNTYRFGAITAGASMPEREVTLDRKLVETANEELAGESTPDWQIERGRLMAGLLLPKDLRDNLRSQAPLVLLLDATTARVHWEMVAQPELPGQLAARGSAERQDLPFRDAFLGTARGLTRQLRTTFAPPPEPPPPPQRVLRVLVVADPAEDAHLPGAEEEGAAVADLFESFNAFYQDVPGVRVSVTRLFGPRDATRTNVLRRVMLDRYDVLHYAGHCYFNADDPPASGWVFSHGGILSARELRRIDRIPRFVFSNACESGITPDRSEKRSVDLAPSFAEAFFERGVANFVVTAWPVDDRAAQTFALRLYADLLGVSLAEALGQAQETETTAEPPRHARKPPLPMYAAMRNARLQIANTPNGARTWGAYQHYGNPYYRFFDERILTRASAPPAGPSTGEPPEEKPAEEPKRPAKKTRTRRASARRRRKKRAAKKSSRRKK